MIPFFDLRAQLNEIGAEIRAAIDGVLDSGVFVMGPCVDEFEKAFAGYVGAASCVGVNSGTDAITIALQAAGVGPGDEVVTVPNTAIPTVAAIRSAGALPVFVDVDPSTYTMDPALLDQCLDERGGKVKAVVPVHLYGHPAPMDAIVELTRARGVVVVEDACQAHGAEFGGRKAGAIGDLGCFSFYPTKNLGCYGDGGAIITNDPELEERVRLLRNYGQRDRYHASMEGVNSRLDEVQAAVLSVKLGRLEGWLEKRRALARIYDECIDGGKAGKPVETPGARHVHHLYVIRHPARDALRGYLEANGVATLIHYPVPIHLQDAYSYLGLPAGSFPVSEAAAGEILSLPIYPELDQESVERVAGLINAFQG